MQIHLLIIITASIPVSTANFIWHVGKKPTFFLHVGKKPVIFFPTSKAGSGDWYQGYVKHTLRTCRYQGGREWVQILFCRQLGSLWPCLQWSTILWDVQVCSTRL